MSDLFQEHKRFIVALAVGALVFVVGWLVIDALFAGDIEKSRRNIDKYRRETANAVPVQMLDRAQKDARLAEESLGALTKAIDRVPASLTLESGSVAPFFLPPNERSPDLYFNRVREHIRSTQLEQCAIQNIDVDPDLGLPDAFPTTPREFDWYLRGLDVVHQVLGWVLDIEQGQPGGIARVEKIEMQPAPKTRTSNVVTPWLEDHKVSFVVVGHPQAIFQLVERLAKKRDDGRFLQVANASIRSLDFPPGSTAKMGRGIEPADRDRVEARLDLVAVEVNAEGKVMRLGRSAP